MYKKYRILHIITGNYVVIEYDYTCGTISEVFTKWIKEVSYNCSFFLNETYIYDKNNPNIHSLFTNKKLLKKLIKSKEFLCDIEMDTEYPVYENEFEIVEA